MTRQQHRDLINGALVGFGAFFGLAWLITLIETAVHVATHWR